MLRTGSMIGVCLGCLLVTGGRAQAPKEDVQLQVVKYDGLKNAVLKNRGKVILVDFWGTF